MLRRLGRWLSAAVLLTVATAVAVINLSATAAPADTETRLYPEQPRDLLARFDAVTRLQSRTRVVAGDLDSLMITYVQRSRVVGFPDYLTVKAVVREGGTGLIVWSRSRYGRGDFGVNRARVEAWLAALE